MVQLDIIIPAEWAPHQAIWTCWPSHPPLWKGTLLAQAREEVAGMVRILAEGDTVKVLAMGGEAVKSARSVLSGMAEVIEARFGDIWLRDTGPIFTPGQALRFRTNGWGGKFVYDFDDEVGDTVAKLSGKPAVHHDFVLENGSLEHDGEGTVLTTRECLCNPNRNPSMDEAAIEAFLKQSLGTKKILWLDTGMRNDHTDGHIDNVARFVAPGRVVCQYAEDEGDPNAAFFEATAAALERMTDAAGRRLDVIRIPGPGLFVNDGGEMIEPSSHMNFIIGNKTIAVPTYGTKTASKAVAMLQEVFPRHKVIGAPSKAILTGGGSFHCITQQEPL